MALTIFAPTEREGFLQVEAMKAHLDVSICVQDSPGEFPAGEVLDFVPLWLTRQLTKGRHGKLGKPYPSPSYTPIHGFHSRSSVVDTCGNGSIFGPCGPCHSADVGWQPPDPKKAAIERWNRRKNPKIAAHKEAGAGNLTENEYAFWVGHPSADVRRSGCRWCNFHAHSKEERRAHFDAGECGTLLRDLYKFARRTSPHKNCMTCGVHTTHQRWGVWLCNDAECIRRWKFNEPGMLIGLRDYLEDARFRQIL